MQEYERNNRINLENVKQQLKTEQDPNKKAELQMK